jgi:ribonuclease VapC
VTGLVVDSSAIVAIMQEEPAAGGLREVLFASELAVIGAPTAVEVGLVLEGRRDSVVGAGQRAIRELGLVVTPFTPEHAERAVDVWRRFGKGRHPAGLDFGDCCTYAVAEERGLPILCVGDDFRRTGWSVVDGR